MASKSQRSFNPNASSRNMMSSQATSASRDKRKSNMSFSSRRSVATNLNSVQTERMEKPSKFGVTIYDEQGNDVTPKALYTVEGGAQGHSMLVGGEATPTDGAKSFASLFQTATQSIYAQPFSSSMYKSGMMSMSKTSMQSSQENIIDTGDISGFGDVTHIRRDVKEILTEEDLEKTVNITLEETETMWFLDQDGTCVSNESEEKDEILEKNQKYEALCKIREGNDMYAEREMQTFDFAPKNKDVQTDKIGKHDVGSDVTTWDIYDTYEALNNPVEEEDSEEKSKSRGGSAAKRDANLNLKGDGKPFGGSMMSNMSRMTESFAGFGTTVSDVPAGNEDFEEDVELDVEEQWEFLKTESESLYEKLTVIERIVTQNIYQPKLAAYRGLPIYVDVNRDTESTGQSESEEQVIERSSEILESMGPCLDRLWSFCCPLTLGKNVSCLSWNRSNPDIIAAGYGSFNFSEHNKTKMGLVCCWNLKNLEHPERIYVCKASVSAIDFSTYQPNMLAVGCTDGIVCVYNVRDRSDQPILDSFDCPDKHACAVWQLKWIERENAAEKSERLISVAADGRVVEWLIRKGLECTDLMKLRRSVSKPNPQAANKKREKPEALLARQAPGMSFDFHPKDTNVYLAGTEEGYIHKCSCQYNEQFLDTYHGHSSSVYKVKWSPFNDDVFISCGADWSLKLWSHEETRPMMSLLSTTKAVHDISWSPYSSTVFCAVNEGAVEIWDLSVNTLDPLVIKVATPGTKLSCCEFSRNSNSVAVGDTDGNVTFYQLGNIGTTQVEETRGKECELHRVMVSSFTEMKESTSDTKTK